MVLVEDMVSRRHAKITVTNGQLFIQDLGSTNGSFVNGERIKRSKLSEGDRVLIGTSIIKVVAREGATTPQEARTSLEDVAAGKRTSQVRTMTGSIAEVPLPDLLQLFASSKKSGTLVVRNDKDTGKLHLDKGRVQYAVVNDHYEVAPEKSFFRILTWDDGTFDMEQAEEREFPSQIEMSTEGLLMEAMRQVDEVKRLGPDVPPHNARLEVSVPLLPQLRDLTPDELDVLQNTLNHSRVDAVLNHSAAGDVRTNELIVKLIKKGYLRVQ
jgi:pSer/pThr/pTyr-binding forkhead associated (FHA) protein